MNKTSDQLREYAWTFITDKELMSLIYKELLKMGKEITNNLLEKEAKNITRQFTEMQMDLKLYERWSTLLK